MQPKRGGSRIPGIILHNCANLDNAPDIVNVFAEYYSPVCQN